MSTPSIGLLVNPSAGRDVRRLTGGASVSDTYGKRRAAECVLAGVGLADDPVDVVVAPDSGEIGQRTVTEAEDTNAASVRLLNSSVEGTGADTQRAAVKFRDQVDAVVVLGGDGTTRDLAVEIGDVPVLAVSTGTNNVVPTPVDGTVAGAAAAMVATEAVDSAEVTTRHTMVEARIDDGRSIRGLATAGIVDQSFVGTRAVLDPDDFLGGAVSRAGRGEVGLSGIAGALTRINPGDERGVALELDSDAQRTVSATTAPGVVERIGVTDWKHLGTEQEHAFEVGEAVVSVDGERELEVQDAEIRVRPVPDGPRLVDFDAVFEASPLPAQRARQQ